MKRVDYAHGLVIGKFYPPHRGHEYLIRTAARHCRSVTVGVLGSSVESISIARRVAWLRDIFSTERHVRIVGELDDVPVDYNSPAAWASHVAIMRKAVQAADHEYGKAPAVDAVFTSEHYGGELARHFGAAHVCLDNARTLYPVSGTAARAHPVSQWDLLPPAVRAGLALRVVVLGAESTGTTTLARDLADALRRRGGTWAGTAWVAEYGREHSLNLLALARAFKPDATAADISWQSADFTVIAAEQCRQEEEAARHGSPVLVCDTDAFATCIWHERYMGQPSPQVARLAAAMPPRALYLLTSDTGVPFEDDGLRDGEHLRGWMTERFRAVLREQGVPWLEVEGSPDARCRSALAAVDALLEKAWQFAAPLEQRQQLAQS
ncbi:AAA family ATPase [Polaromonas sp. YR568]|uniref:AAA family ATPase n=1 Tax=Polaromonas sp. YR568 TaxID=1855301 RepID=UPI00398C0D33